MSRRAIYLVSLLIALSLMACIVFADDLVQVFGPQTFYRGEGKPFIEHATFQSPAAGTGIIIIQNGITSDGDETKNVCSGTIWVNGQKLVIPKMLNQHADGFQYQIDLNNGNNSLDVELRSAPGSCMTITILGPGEQPELL